MMKSLWKHFSQPVAVDVEAPNDGNVASEHSRGCRAGMKTYIINLDPAVTVVLNL